MKVLFSGCYFQCCAHSAHLRCFSDCSYHARTYYTTDPLRSLRRPYRWFSLALGSPARPRTLLSHHSLSYVCYPPSRWQSGSFMIRWNPLLPNSPPHCWGRLASYFATIRGRILGESFAWRGESSCSWLSHRTGAAEWSMKRTHHQCDSRQRQSQWCRLGSCLIGGNSNPL